MRELRGSWVAVPTPYDHRGAVNYAMFDRLIELHAENGSCALLVMGSCGEATLLSSEERHAIIDHVARSAETRIPVFFGTTCPTTEATIELTRYAADGGAAGVVLVVPPYVTPPQEAVLEHFAMVATSVKCPVALYNNPTRVQVNIEPETIARLHREAPNLYIDKEAMADSSQIAEVLRLTGGEVKVFCCDYPKYGLIPAVLALGGSGTANVTGNVAPAEMAEISQPFDAETDMAGWRTRYFRLLPLMKALYWFTNPVVVKAALNLMGIEVGSVRRPLADLRGPQLKELDGLLRDLGLTKRYSRWASRTSIAAS